MEKLFIQLQQEIKSVVGEDAIIHFLKKSVLENKLGQQIGLLDIFLHL